METVAGQLQTNARLSTTKAEGFKLQSLFRRVLFQNQTPKLQYVVFRIARWSCLNKSDIEQQYIVVRIVIIRWWWWW